MRLAAVDVGSNAIRLQISRILNGEDGKPKFKKLEFIRFPLRLGQDTFRTGEITYRSEMKFISLMESFRRLIDLYDVDDYYGCATSAMRDAVNGQRILDRAYDMSGLIVKLIDGEREAEIITNAVFDDLGDGNYIHVDVGGGSTEINIIKNKENIARRSFQLGSVRNMIHKESDHVWDKFKSWITNEIETLDSKTDIIAVGTGGNIRKLADLAKGNKTFSYEELKKTKDLVANLNLEDRIKTLQLREDRADVLPFASKIYLTAMKSAGAEEMRVPDIGLKDGIIKMLHQRNL